MCVSLIVALQWTWENVKGSLEGMGRGESWTWARCSPAPCCISACGGLLDSVARQWDMILLYQLYLDLNASFMARSLTWQWTMLVISNWRYGCCFRALSEPWTLGSILRGRTIPLDPCSLAGFSTYLCFSQFFFPLKQNSCKMMCNLIFHCLAKIWNQFRGWALASEPKELGWAV